MKSFILLICLTSFICSTQTINAQESRDVSDLETSNYIVRNAIYDYSELQLNNTDTIPGFETKSNKIKIVGTIYESDGVTPAKGVIVYISQSDENGDYDLKTHNGKRYINHRGWAKTDADGQYVFYTFIPNIDVRNKELRYINTTLKEPGKVEYNINGFLFDDDPFLTKSCRKKLEKINESNSILKLEKKGDLMVATRDIILVDDNLFTKK